MDSAPKRPWYRLHWVTWVVIGLVAGSLMLSAFRERRGIEILMSSGEFGSMSYFGWPWAHVQKTVSGTYVGAGVPGGVGLGPGAPGGLVGLGPLVSRSVEYTWHWSTLVFNVLMNVMIIGATTWVADTWLRSPNRLQIKVRALLAFTAVVAVFLWLLLNSEWLFHSPGMHLTWVNSPLVSWDDFRQPLRWPIVLGLACTIYSLGWLALALLRRAYRFVRP